MDYNQLQQDWEKLGEVPDEDLLNMYLKLPSSLRVLPSTLPELVTYKTRGESLVDLQKDPGELSDLYVLETLHEFLASIDKAVLDLEVPLCEIDKKISLYHRAILEKMKATLKLEQVLEDQRVRKEEISAGNFPPPHQRPAPLPPKDATGPFLAEQELWEQNIRWTKLIENKAKRELLEILRPVAEILLTQGYKVRDLLG